MSYQLVEKQVIYNGKKVKLEVHHLEDRDDPTQRTAGRCAFTRGRWWCCRSCRTGG